MTDITDAPIFYWHESPGNRFRVDVADFDEAAECAYCVPVYSAETVDRLRARVAKLESARGEPVAWMNPYGGTLQVRITGLEYEKYTIPLYTAPPAQAVDVDAISDEAIEQGCEAMWAHSARSSTRGNDVAIDKDKVFELFERYWEIAFNEGRTGEGFADLANDVLAELRDVLDADDGDVFTGQLVEIDGHVYGLRPGAARVVREALLDARRYKWLRDTPGVSWDELTDGGVSMWVGDASAIRAPSLDAAIDAAMAKDGA